MTCPAPTNVVLAYHESPKGRFSLSWTPPVPLGLNIHIDLVMSEPNENYDSVYVESALLGPGATFWSSKPERPAPDSVWYARIYNLCTDCKESEHVLSNELNFCLLDSPPSISSCNYTPPNFLIMVPKTDLDGDCPADSVDVHLVDPSAGEHDYNIPRASWGDGGANYIMTIMWAAPPAGTYTFTVRSRMDAGSVSSWSASCQVVIP